MNRPIQKLRNKYIFTASSIVLFVILSMILILNLVMYRSYQKQNQIMENVILGAAEDQSSIQRESFILEDIQKTDAGEYVLTRNVKEIKDVTLYGSISCEHKNAIWYSAGGGLVFNVVYNGMTLPVYKDYTFNKDAKSVTVSFDNYDNLKCGLMLVDVEESQIVEDEFIISPVWWQSWGSTDASEGNGNDGVNLVIDSVEIHYKDNHSQKLSSSGSISHYTFQDVFETIPEVVNTTGAFYFITDENGSLISINEGNLMTKIENQEAEQLTTDIFNNAKEKGSIKIDNVSYRYRIVKEDGIQYILFLCNSTMDKSMTTLIIVSVSVALFVWLLLFFFIIKVSQKVIQPIQESTRLQKEFISNAGHELKTPITVISTAADIISRKNGADQWTECIKAQSQKMSRLVANLLELSKLEETEWNAVSFETMNLSELIENTLLSFEGRFFESQKKMITDIEPNLDFPCNTTKMEELINILTDNALKYSDDHSEIFISLKKEKNYILLTFQNCCQSFSEIESKKVFDRFYRSENDLSNEKEGFGLGLSIAASIVELHNGLISCEYNSPNVVFTVKLKG